MTVGKCHLVQPEPRQSIIRLSRLVHMREIVVFRVCAFDLGSRLETRLKSKLSLLAWNVVLIRRIEGAVRLLFAVNRIVLKIQIVDRLDLCTRL